jgi:DNA-binding MarR family transcriptional regulator
MTFDPATEDPPWLSADQLDDWVALMGLLSTLPTALDAQLKRDTGLNLYEYHILVRLGDAEQGRLPMSDLALRAQGSPSRLTHAVSRLENAGYVRKVACSDAGRRIAAILTPKGREKLEESAPGHVREARRLVIDALTASQLAALGDACRTISRVADPNLTLPGQ